jgi:hypothetical protein
MNGYQENPENWTPIVWRLIYKEAPADIVWATDLVGALKEAERQEAPIDVVFHDRYWLNCTQTGIRRAMSEVARAGGMSGAIAA